MKKRLILLILLAIFFVIGFLVLIYISSQKFTFNSRAEERPSCVAYGYFEFKNDNLEQRLISELQDFCKKKITYMYGGGWGDKALCFSNTKLCSTVENPFLERNLVCLNEKTSIEDCIRAGKAPANVYTREINCPADGVEKYGWGQWNNCYLLNGGIKYRPSGEPYCANTIVDVHFCCPPGSTNPKCPQPSTVIATAQPSETACYGQKCGDKRSGYTEIGVCPRGYLLRCECVKNKAKFVADKGCSSNITPAVAKCSYGESVITVSTSPFKYVDSGNFCIIDSNGNNVGARCQSYNGFLVNGNAKNDTINCPKPIIGACISNESKWKNDTKACKYGNNKYLPYGKCLPGNYKCKCDDKAKYSYPTLQIDTSCGT